jgi:pimeloyl-ACP methyl ester carboxylesterase
VVWIHETDGDHPSRSNHSLFENCGHRPNAIPPADQEDCFRSCRKFGIFGAMLELYRTLPMDAADNRANLGRLGRLTMPVLALGGEKAFGRGMECIDSSRRVAEDVRDGSVPDCGHCKEEQPDFLAEALMQFFTANDRR